MISGIRFGVLMLGLLASPALAQEADPPSLVQVMADLAGGHNTMTHFSEERYDHALTEPLHSTGILAYVPPDHIEKVTITPAPQSLIVTGTELTVSDEGETHHLDLSDYPEIAGFVEGIRATLQGNLPMLKQYYAVAFTGDEARWTMALTPLDGDMTKIVSQIRIDGQKSHLTKIVTAQTNGDRSEMIITP